MNSMEEERELALLEAERLVELGNIEREQSNYAEALRCYQGSLGIFRRHGDRNGEAVALGGLGVGHLRLGQHGRASEIITQAIDILREVGDKLREGGCVANLGNVYYAQGEYERAIEHYTQAYDIFREVGHRRREGHALGSLGTAYATQGQQDRAIQFFSQAQGIFKEVGDRLGEGISLGNLGESLVELGRLDEAEAALRGAISIGDGSSHILAGVFRGSLALSLARQGKFDEVKTLIETGEVQVEVEPEEHAGFLCKKGRIFHLAGDAESARAALKQAQEIVSELKLSGDSTVGQAVAVLVAVLQDEDRGAQ